MRSIPLQGVVLGAAICFTACGLSFSVPLCQTSPDQSVPASPVGATSVSETYPLDLQAALSQAGAIANVQSLQLNNVTLIARSGIEDFTWIRSATASLLPDGGAPMQVLQYENASGADAGSPLELATSTSDVWPVLSQPQPSLQVDLNGIAPDVDWSFAAKTCMTLTY